MAIGDSIGNLFSGSVDNVVLSSRFFGLGYGFPGLTGITDTAPQLQIAGGPETALQWLNRRMEEMRVKL